MNTREQLNQYLRGLESRLRLQVVSKGAAVALGVALGATVALVLITNAFAFSSTSLVIARITLFLALAFALGMALVMPLIRLNQRRAAGRAEAVFPDFQERLVTYVERRDNADPFIDLLAADTLEHAPKAPPSQVVTPKSIFALATSAGAAGAVLLWLILAGPGFLGYGASMLWAGPPKNASVDGAYYRITVEPGDKLVRRRSDMPIRATLIGFQAPEVRLMARYKSSAKWEQAPMLPRANDSSYEYLFAAVPEPVEYYVEANGVRSKTYKLDVIDLAGVKNIKVTYHYPAWLGKRDDVENPGGDLRAVIKTVAELEVETDRPLKNGIIELNDGTKINLEAKSGNFLTAKVPIEQDGAYHFAAVEGSENVRITQDYFIEAKEDAPPSVKITHPGADAKVSTIEEVTITVQSSDDFGLQAMDLHYSVNGQQEKVVSLLNAKGSLNGEGKVVLNLEDFKLVPGDVVSMYATANDAKARTVGDITFIEAQPFEKNYSQSQQGGGGGGGGGGGQQDDPSQITQREKEIIAATHNFNRGGKNAQANAENAQYLSEVQTKLKEQAASMAKRTQARELSTENQDFQSFTKEMEAAAAEMGPAADKLKGQKWSDALEPENKALQHLSRAMATFRDIQVSRGQQGGGGGGGGGADAGRDLANLFDLELDTEKNQYESQQSSSGDKQQQAVDEAMQKLEQLARRQQQLAQQKQNNKQQASVDRRWEQEQLRRELEDLKKQLQQAQQQQQQNGQQLSRNGQQSSQGQGQQSQSQGGKQGGQSASSQQIQRMLDQIKQAQDDQRQSQQAQQNGDQAQADAAARRAAERLNEARDIGDRMRRQDTAGQLDDLKARADQVGEKQKELENRLRQQVAGNGKDGKGGASKQQTDQLASDLDKNLEDLKKLEQDIQRSARDLRATQPDASTKLRDGVSEIQQNDVERRIQYSAEYIRQGRADQVNQSGWLPPVNRALDTMREGVRQAQQALNDGNKQGAGKNERDQQLAQVESLRRQLEQFARGQQPGQQQGNQQGQGQGKDGQQQGKGQGQGKDGQQPGQGQGGGNQNGGNQNGGQYGGNQFGGNRVGGYIGGQFGRWNPQGYYDMPDGRRAEPGQIVRDFARDLNDLRQRFKDDPEMARQISDVERALTQASVGDTSGPVLQERLSRTVLPQLETLEVQMRQKAGEETGGQVRSAGTERTPDGFANAISEYFRQLAGKTKTQ